MQHSAENSENRIRVLAVAPYEGMNELITRVAQEMPDMDITKVTGDLGEGVKAAREVIDRGFDVIISRGGTADLLDEAFNLPVINVDVSGYDFVRVIKLAQSSSGRAAVVGFAKITVGASIICDLLKSSYRIYTVSHEREVDRVLEKLQREGYSVIIGDYVTVKAARRRSMNAILVTSGRESIQKALNDARQICRYVGRARGYSRRLEEGLGALGDAVFILSDRGEEVFVSAGEADRAPLGEAIRSLAATPSAAGCESIVRISDVTWRVSSRPLGGGGTIFTARRMADCGFTFASGVHVRSGKAGVQAPFAAFAAREEPFSSTIDRARALGASRAPIYIWGDRGTGKSMLAYAIHLSSPVSPRLFITVDCALTDAAAWEALLGPIGGDGGDGSPLVENPPGTLYIKNIDRLPPAAARRLRELFEGDAAVRGWRLISSAEASPETLAEGAADPVLARETAGFPLRIPSLGERRESMGDLAALMIADADDRYGREVVGLEPDALERIKDFDWEYNIDQLREVMTELVLSCRSSYITSREVARALDKRGERRAPQRGPISRSMTMRQIEAEIIKQVLAEENGNQSRAAKRLDISRSTMWRKLKENG